MPAERRGCARRERDGGCEQRSGGRDAYLPWGAAARTCDQPLTATAPLSRQTVEAVDSERLLADILSVPDQLRDALWRVQSANLDPHNPPDPIAIFDCQLW